MLPSLYIPHGGGPCFFMDWTMGPSDTWDRMGAWLSGAVDTLDRRPAAIVVVSAHWESPAVAVTSGERPPLIYDYYGFPPHTYELTFPAPGAPALAAAIMTLLERAGMAAVADPSRGFDHGVFIPLKLMVPHADIPVVQVSLVDGLDADVHLALGRALAPLRDDDVLIVGSGMSYHNLPELMRGQSHIEASDRFDAWLDETCRAPAVERERRLRDWLAAPAALDAHPRAEHLLPLMVAAGAAGNDAGNRVFTGSCDGQHRLCVCIRLTRYPAAHHYIQDCFAYAVAAPVRSGPNCTTIRGGFVS